MKMFNPLGNRVEDNKYIVSKIVWTMEPKIYQTVHEQKQGVYKYNLTNFQETPGRISRNIQDMFALLWPAVQCNESTSAM